MMRMAAQTYYYYYSSSEKVFHIVGRELAILARLVPSIIPKYLVLEIRKEIQLVGGGGMTDDLTIK